MYKYFEDIVGGDDIGCAKPSPCPLDKIIHSLNINKGEAIIVGDMDIDILAGRKADIITCAVTYGIGKKEDIIKANPDFIIDDIMKLKDIMN
ncbi:HAD-IA family hydrolase [candidate division WOR-3 bacterium]|nr:HAD-IA family hydrolase [candidate division WOR-3 bacterium]